MINYFHIATALIAGAVLSASVFAAMSYMLAADVAAAIDKISYELEIADAEIDLLRDFINSNDEGIDD